MKLGKYYALVTDKCTGKTELITVPRIKAGEPQISAYTRWLGINADKHQGRYTSSGLAFGQIRITYNSKLKTGEVKIGFTKVGIVTPRPAILSIGFTSPIGVPLYITGVGRTLADSESIEIRDLLKAYLHDAIWSLE